MNNTYLLTLTVAIGETPVVFHLSSVSTARAVLAALAGHTIIKARISPKGF